MNFLEPLSDHILNQKYDIVKVSHLDIFHKVLIEGRRNHVLYCSAKGCLFLSIMILLPKNSFVFLNTNLRVKNIFKEISALSIIRITKYINDFFNFITYKIKKLLTILKRRGIIIYVNKTCLKNMF